MLSQTVPKLAKKKLFRTYSTSFNHCLIIVEYAVQLLEAGVNVSHIVLGQNVTPAQTETVFHIHKTLIAALRQAQQQAHTHKPQSRCLHLSMWALKTQLMFLCRCFDSNPGLIATKNEQILRFLFSFFFRAWWIRALYLCSHPTRG